MPRLVLGWTGAQDVSMMRAADCRVEDLAVVCAEQTRIEEYPLADRVESNVLIYTAADLLAADDAAAQEEMARALLSGPGVLIVTGAVEPDSVDRASAAFWRMIDDQRAVGQQAGDHFAVAGANDRVWNSLEKLAVADPGAFIDYHGSAVVDLVARAWLGPAYQLTAQVNVVNPGGEAQVPHRDYHLGFMSTEQAERYPDHVHALSPVLTLQAAIAHDDTPLETGPTMLLPHSQKYPGGYLIAGREDFRAYTEGACVQVPFAKGDAIFFNPALIHGAGTNRTPDVRRMVNLLQVSSAMGRAMETVDRERMVRALYPQMLARGNDPRVPLAVAAAAEGYAFPTNLDRDPPLYGLAPPSQADLLRQALRERWSPPVLDDALAEHAKRRKTI